MFAYETEYLFSYRASIAPPEVIGPAPGDIRFNFALTGGEISGPKLQGKVRGGGADFATLRSDGVVLVDVRGTLESHDGALIDITYQGMLDLGPDGYANFLAGQMPAELKVRTAPRFRTAHPAYQWLNRIQCYSIGEADLAKLEIGYDVYALR
ncbi:DUF3237 domain-containing protein [uncultured Nevskia sp.]|uniref:DUF3237 domain-containing protein n=1 Tax=uncultured Nevskia sp. TaxID=228950 RepID=UPI0025D1C228|nr:DUF3237 domain-containing protein [uncultured Nevskia sp.]